MNLSKRFNAIPVIFPGHGGMIDGEYVTAPDRMYEFEDGLTVYEGEINRKICGWITHCLNIGGMAYIYNDTELDTPLSTKVDVAERYNSAFGNCFLLDIHNNAAKGTGSEIFTSPGQTASDPIATEIINKVEKSMGKDWEIRKGLRDGDPDKERKFYVLMNTYLPSVLFEGGFMDTRSDAEIITSEEGQKKLGLGIANGILKLNGIKMLKLNEIE